MNRDVIRYTMKIRRGMQTRDTLAQQKHAEVQSSLLEITQESQRRDRMHQRDMLQEAYLQTRALGRVADALEGILAIATAEHGPDTPPAYFDKPRG